MRDRHGGEFTRRFLSLSPKLQLSSDVFVHAFCLAVETSFALSPWALIKHQGHPNEVPAWLDSNCPSFPQGRRELSVWKTLPFRNRLIPHLHPSASQSRGTDADIQALSQCSHEKKQAQICYLWPDKAHVSAVDKMMEMSFHWAKMGLSEVNIWGNSQTDLCQTEPELVVFKQMMEFFHNSKVYCDGWTGHLEFIFLSWYEFMK